MSTKTSLLNGPFDIVSLTCFANIFMQIFSMIFKSN